MGIKEDIKQGNFKSNAEMAMVNILFTYNWLNEHQIGTLKKHDILPQHYNILRIVKGKHPKVIYPGQIKEVMIDRGRDLTRLIDKLVKSGYLSRQVCDINRRMVEISITSLGIKIVDDIAVEIDKNTKEIVNLSDKEALTLSELLDKLRG